MSNEWHYEGGCGSYGRGRGVRGRGNGGGDRGRGRKGGGRRQFEGQRSPMSSIQCYYCKRYGHKEDKCWDKQHDEKEHTNFAQSVGGEESKLF